MQFCIQAVTDMPRSLSVQCQTTNKFISLRFPFVHTKAELNEGFFKSFQHFWPDIYVKKSYDNAA